MAIGALEYLDRSNIFSSVRSLLKDLCNMDLAVYDLHGKLVHNNSSLQSTQSDFFDAIFFRKISSDPYEEDPIPGSIRQQVCLAKEPVIFLGKDRFNKIVVPLISENEVLGLLYTGEKPPINLQKSQLKSIMDYLFATINKIIQDDFKLFKEMHASDLSHQRKILYRVTEYLNRNYHVPELTMNEVCQNNNISYYYLSHLFKKELKTTFSKYLSALRVDVASRLLKDRSLTVSQVSHSCGFEDPGYFTKVFKKMRGASPMIYRDRLFAQRNGKAFRPKRQKITTL